MDKKRRLKKSNQQLDIRDIYLPLTLYCEKNKYKAKIDNFNKNIIEPYKKILITDTAGMGKSTLLKFLTLNIIEQSEGIPLLIDLRNLKETNLVLDEIFNQLNERKNTN